MKPAVSRDRWPGTRWQLHVQQLRVSRQSFAAALGRQERTAAIHERRDSGVLSQSETGQGRQPRWQADVADHSVDLGQLRHTAAYPSVQDRRRVHSLATVRVRGTGVG